LQARAKRIKTDHELSRNIDRTAKHEGCMLALLLDSLASEKRLLSSSVCFILLDCTDAINERRIV